MFKKMFYGFFIFIILTVFSSIIVFADSDKKENNETAKWSPNNPALAIFDDPLGENLFKLEYNDIPAEEIDTSNFIRLFMVDGGFVAYSETIIENGRTMIPLNVLTSILDCNAKENESSVTIKHGQTELIFTHGSNTVMVNCKSKTTDCPMKILNDKIYIPLRFTFEEFGANVNYFPEMNYRNNEYNLPYMAIRNKVCLTAVEFPSNEYVYSAEYGLNEIKKLSSEMYQQVSDYLKETDRTFSEIDKDYDSQSIEYSGFDIGRYYVYKLKGFEAFPIFFNKYTGKIYSEFAGLPFIDIREGFINISWIYQ